MANFPSAVSTEAQLGIAANGAQTQLNGAINNAVTTITVDDTTSFASAGYIVIDSEIIKYTGKTATTFTGCTRGSDGSAAASHTDNTAVYGYIIAAHTNNLKDEVIAIEQNISDRFGLGSTSIVVPSTVTFEVNGTTATFTGSNATSFTAAKFINSNTTADSLMLMDLVTGVTVGARFRLRRENGTSDTELKFQTLVNGSLVDNILFTRVSTTPVVQLGSAAYLIIPLTSNQLVLGTTNTVTISATAPAASRVYTMADVGASATFVMSQGALTIEGQKTFSGSTTIFTGTNATSFTTAQFINSNTTADSLVLVDIVSGVTVGGRLRLRRESGTIAHELKIQNLVNSALVDNIILTRSGTQPVCQFSGGAVVGTAALNTAATDGFLYIPTCAGAPSGVPSTWTGTVAMVYDTTNNKLYIYNSGWKGGTAPGTWS